MLPITGISNQAVTSRIVYRTWLDFVEGNGTLNREKYTLIYLWLKTEMNVGLTQSRECDIWESVKVSPYTWDQARLALEHYYKEGQEIPPGFNALKAMDYGHRCCKEVFSMWGVDTSRVKQLLKIG